MKYLSVLLVFALPLTLMANHNSSRIDRDDLDDDIVETVPIPLLFAIDLDEVIPDFGAPRDGGIRSHEGQDFSVPLGTPIVSPTEAIVIGLGTWDGGGRYVQTANPGGETFRYMHLDEWADLDSGDELDVGDYIGTVGDTGNAAPGAYHLHFEILDEDRNPQDPYPRLGDAFDLEDQMDFLNDIFRDRRDDDDYAAFLVETFPSTFSQALAEDINMPRAIDEVIEDLDWKAEAESLQDLTDLIASIPALLPPTITTGDSGALVTLLQIYLIYTGDGAARDRLAAAGPTGYYGSITAGAVLELQAEIDAAETGVYDAAARAAFMDREVDSLAF